MTASGSVTVLLVEDEWLLRYEIAEELRHLDWTVEEVSSGEDALLLLEQGRKFDFLITDIRLTGAVTGWDVAEAYRKAQPGLPVIYVSANPVMPSRQVQGSLFFNKPCDMPALMRSCRALLR